MTPSSRMLALLAAATAGPILVIYPGIPHAAGIAVILAALLVAVFDRVFGCECSFDVTRQTGRILSVGTDNDVSLLVVNNGKREVNIEVMDEPPLQGRLTPLDEHRVVLGPRERKRLRSMFRPFERGQAVFTGVQMRFQSRLGLWTVHVRLPVETVIQVYPDIAALSRYELLARRNNLAELGYRATRIKGEGHEFERMRDYRVGDEPRKVDWKTTARTGRLIVREMGQDRNQNILFLIDTGRMMQVEDGGTSHFDHALNTAIMLGHIARKKGDSIGAVLFSNDIHRVIPLTRGRDSVETLVHAAYDLFPDDTATDYRKAYEYVMKHVRRRSLVLLMTNLIPGEDFRLIQTCTGHISRQHLPVCLFFEDASLEADLTVPPTSVVEAFHRGAAADLVMNRLNALSAFRSDGVLALQASASEYTATAISNYLDIKARNLL